MLIFTQPATKIAFLAIALGIAGLIQLAAPASNTSALSYKEMTAEQKAESWWRYKAVEKCLNLGLAKQWHYRPADLKSGAWWYSGDEKVFGGFMRDMIPGIGDDFSIECKTSPNGVLQTSLSFWGIESGLTLLCGEQDAGDNDADPTDNIVSRSNNGDCFSGSADFDEVNYGSRDVRDGPAWNQKQELVLERIRDIVYDGKDVENLVGGPRYFYYYKTLLNSCAYNGAKTTTKPSGGNVYEIAEWDSAQQKMVTVWYTGNKPATASVKAWPGGSQMTCGEMAEAIKDPKGALPSLFGDLAINGQAGDIIDFDNDGSDDATSTCAIPGMGWIICPAIELMSNVSDSVYGLISRFLEVDTSLYSQYVKDANGDDTDVGTGTYNGWTAMRNIANVGFVIVFMIIIFSQLTGQGVSNYGVKKVLPRLILVVVAINLSFYICQLAVDLSNVLGATLNSFIKNIAMFDSDATGFGAQGNTFTNVAIQLLMGYAAFQATGVATVAVSAGIISYGSIGLFVIVLLAGLLAILTTLAILAARQAFIVVLIVVAPLAILAMALPNTKSLFDKWRKMFIALLVIYPMLGIVFGASAMASSIILQSANSAGDFVPVILGLGVATIPLFATIPILKGSLNAIPIAGNLAQKLAKSNPLGGVAKGGLKQASTNFKNDARARALRVGGTRPNLFARGIRAVAGGSAVRSSKSALYETEAKKAAAGYVADRALDPNNTSATISEMAAAVSTQSKIQEEEIANLVALDTHRNVSPGELLNRLTDPSASVSQKLAAVRQIESRGGMAEKLRMSQLTENIGEAEVRQGIAQSSAKLGDASPSYGGRSLQRMQDGDFNRDMAHVDFAKSDQFSAKKLLNMHPVTRAEFFDSLARSGDAEAMAALTQARALIDQNGTLRAEAGKDFMRDLDATVAGTYRLPVPNPPGGAPQAPAAGP